MYFKNIIRIKLSFIINKENFIDFFSLGNNKLQIAAACHLIQKKKKKKLTKLSYVYYNYCLNSNIEEELREWGRELLLLQNI